MESKNIIKWLESIIKRNKKAGNPHSTDYVLVKDGYAVATDSKVMLRVRADMLLSSLSDGWYEVLAGRLVRIPDGDVEAQALRFPDFSRVLNRSQHAHMLTSRVPACLASIKEQIAVVVPVHPGDGWTLGRHDFAPCLDCRFLPPCGETEWKIEWLDSSNAYAYPVFFLTDGIEYAVMPIDTREANPWDTAHTDFGIMWVARHFSVQEVER